MRYLVTYGPDGVDGDDYPSDVGTLRHVRLAEGYSHYGWDRAGIFFAEVRRERAAALSQAAQSFSPFDMPCERGDLPLLLSRQSVRFFLDSPVSSGAGAELAREATDLQLRHPWLRVLAIAQAVEGFAANTVLCAHAGRWVVQPRTADPAAIDRLARGMWWVNGGGLLMFFCVDLPTLYENPTERTYLELLLALGACCQGVLRCATQLGLGGWMTPAIEETKTQETLGCEPTIEPLYMLKLGNPVPFEQLSEPELVRGHAVRMGARP